MSKVIRLTESDLHNMIKEAINELDWRTYVSAAQKDNRGRASAFKDAAVNSFNKKYNKGLNKNKFDLRTNPDLDYITVDDVSDENNHSRFASYNLYGNEYGMKNGDRLSAVDPDSIPQAKLRQNLKQAAKDLRDFNRGKSHYNPDTHAWENDED